ncbi:MAG: transcriptional regulator [Candidatus Melainabacteria bacterium HGW-Melainabacteria-1]|nr:MAG: transcriptional regulator [Candidatus Melainabacteria bacterium HGW-Melainabacteria-1]
MLPKRKDQRPPLHALPDDNASIKQTLELDRLIHERLRLGIVSALAVNPSLSFSDLKLILSTSDGNLSVHARKLEEAGYIRCDKFFEGRVPRTEYQLTDVGRLALQRYLNHMEALIQTTRQATSQELQK